VLVEGQQLPVRRVVAHKTSEIARHAGSHRHPARADRQRHRPLTLG
jgi:hypothetical protein